MTIPPALLTARQSAEYLGVSKSYFEEHVRPLLPIVSLAHADARQPMPRWAVADLDDYIAERRREKVA